jgi:hypothetical protein
MLLICNTMCGDCTDHLMGSRSLYFSRTPIPLKIYSADGFYHTASTAAATTEHFKIPGMLWETACLKERDSIVAAATKRGLEARRWERCRGNKTPLDVAWMLTLYSVDKVRIDRESVRYGRTNTHSSKHNCVTSRDWNRVGLTEKGHMSGQSVPRNTSVSLFLRPAEIRSVQWYRILIVKLFFYCKYVFIDSGSCNKTQRFNPPMPELTL